ncbi:MAG: PDC sensor domain-containing protein [Candidatus Omnitrophica bacterium]|nr:PDC sensor domain-containing protein [Candidatus Omnitrophota bacterium]
MRNIGIFLVALMLCVGRSGLVLAADETVLLNEVKKITSEKIVKWAKDPLVVAAVKEANKTASRTNDEIAALDKKWMDAGEPDAWVDGYSANPTAVFLKAFQAVKEGQKTLFPEIFVMDRQGCIVGETNRTSDFLQGDEDKFVRSYAGGKGEVFIDKMEFDESSRTYSIQVSVPVMDPEDGNAIGALTVSIDLDALGERLL